MERVKHLKLPMVFDPVRLQQDLEHVLQHQWTAHYSTDNYEGNWTSVALLSTDGDATSIYAMPNSQQEPMVPTSVLNGCPYFQEVIAAFGFPITSCRLLRLDAGAVIKPHRDHCLGYEDGAFRLHVPIITNPGVEFILAGERIIMDEGTCWYINANEEHSVANRGTANRIHFVIDGERNAWSDALFYALAPEEAFRKEEGVMPAADKAAMIAELERMDTPAARQLLEQLKSEG